MTAIPFAVPALVKTVEVPGAPAAAFRLFTEGFGDWWPLRSHSVGVEKAAACSIEPFVGGRVYERWATGEEHDWGRLLAWEPPHRLVMTWHPGRGPESAQMVEVRFTPIAAGTQVMLTHTGWEKLGDRAARVRENYDGGWTVVLGGFAKAASK